MAKKGGIIKGKRGVIGRAKPPMHPMGAAFQSESKAGLEQSQVLHGVPVTGDRKGKMPGKVSGSTEGVHNVGKLRSAPGKKKF
jgi:hypothetical protein